ncbi:hemolymph lipopolysaccharide-binding protein [Megalopta genalis]|uniref:hemolymph lipopolysaccharide-binding protein n=1 Tax=Megalopta genalis TaxID=115081 RepID=UPI003FCFB56C
MKSVSSPFVALAITAHFVFGFQDVAAFDEEDVKNLEFAKANNRSVTLGECTAEKVTLNGGNNYHATQQVFYINANPQTVFQGPRGYCVTTLDRNDYIPRPRIGAQKLFKHKVVWNEAREICMAEGGQLAVIDSAEKEAVFRNWMTNETIDGIWIGIHDFFEQGSWLDLAGERIASTSYYPWAKHQPSSEDNHRCGILWRTRTTAGISNARCDIRESFICEISLCDASRLVGSLEKYTTLS